MKWKLTGNIFVHVPADILAPVPIKYRTININVVWFGKTVTEDAFFVTIIFTRINFLFQFLLNVVRVVYRFDAIKFFYYFYFAFLPAFLPFMYFRVGF